MLYYKDLEKKYIKLSIYITGHIYIIYIKRISIVKKKRIDEG
jgi:hypothetical protein